MAKAFNGSPRDHGGGPRDDGFVENGGGVSKNEEHAASDVAPLSETERLYETERDSGHEHDARKAGGYEERNKKIGDDQAQQKARISGADPGHDHVSETPRQPRLGSHRAEEHCANNEPSGVVGKA